MASESGFASCGHGVRMSTAAGAVERGTERGLERGDVSHHTLLREAGEVGHFPGVEKRVDDLPVGGVPADEEDIAGW